MRTVLMPQGTHGDVRPLVALGQTLREAGHDVVFGAPPACISWIGGLGFPCHPVGLDFEAPSEQTDRAMDNPIRSVIHAVSLLSRIAEAQFSSMPDVVAGAGLVVGSGLDFAGRSVAERAGIPYLYVCHVPVAFRSRFHPPATVPYRPFPPWLNAMLWWSSALGLRWTVGRRIQAHRERLGLNRVRKLDLFLQSEALLAADQSLAPLPPDCSTHQQTPYWELDEQTPLDPDLERFLSEGPPPVYIGFGSMPDPKPERTLEMLRALPPNTRFVVSNERARRRCTETLPNVCWVGSAPHHLLFRRVAAVVHHGGAGTTHTAARAGVPQIIVPHIVDQYYWAHRVTQLGVGPAPLRLRSLSAQTLTAALAQVQQGSTIQRQAAELAHALTEPARHSMREAVRLCEEARARFHGTAQPW